MLRHFLCPQCKSATPPRGLKQRCPTCGGVLAAGYDYPSIMEKLSPAALQGRTRSIWRYRELLPVMNEAGIVSLGEGGSPVLPLRQVGKNMQASGLFIKDDSVMPLGSFRSRLASVTLSKAKEEMVETITARTGQMEALTLAAYAARAGIGAVLAVRRDALQNQFERSILATGASLFVYECGDSEADAQVNESALAHGWFNASVFHHPYRLEGAKSIGLEMAEFFEWRLPDVIIVPAGGGTILAGIYRAIRDLISLGWVENKLPRLVAVQSGERHPLVEAWRAKKFSTPVSGKNGGPGFGENADFASQAECLALDVLYTSSGAAVDVSAAEADEARLLLSLNEGMIISVAGASALAAALKLDTEGWIKRGERVLLHNPEGAFIATGPSMPGKSGASAMGCGLLHR